MLSASFEQPVDEPTPMTVASHQHIQVTQQRKRCNIPAAHCCIYLKTNRIKCLKVVAIALQNVWQLVIETEYVTVLYCRNLKLRLLKAVFQLHHTPHQPHFLPK